MIENQAIEDKFSHVKIYYSDKGKLIPHGKLKSIQKKTNCSYYICQFEYGNEFVQKSNFTHIVEEFVKKQ